MARVVAITGAGRGIGLAIARRFAALGDRLALNFLDAGENLDAVLGEAKANGGDGMALKGDISRPEDATAFIGAAEERYGQIDVLSTTPESSFLWRPRNALGINGRAPSPSIFPALGHASERRCRG